MGSDASYIERRDAGFGAFALDQFLCFSQLFSVPPRIQRDAEATARQFNSCREADPAA